MKLNVNLRHLKFFYYAAKYGGVTKAASKMPERVERSTISKQISQLEKELGFALLRRQPFQATPAGERIFGLIKPLFEEFPVVVEELRRAHGNLVRIGASPVVLCEYLPAMIEALERAFPDIQLEYSEGLQWQIEEWFKEDQLDLAVTMVEGEPPEHCLCEPLLRLPMVLLVKEQSPLRSAREIWQNKPVPHRLICPKVNDAITRCFQQGLRKRRIDWVSRRTASSIEMAESHVREGLGIAVSLAIPGRAFTPGLRALPLHDFPQVKVGMIWRPNPNPATVALMNQLREQAKRMSDVPAKDAKRRESRRGVEWSRT